jgi:hypothetical protein
VLEPDTADGPLIREESDAIRVVFETALFTRSVIATGYPGGAGSTP